MQPLAKLGPTGAQRDLRTHLTGADLVGFTVRLASTRTAVRRETDLLIDLASIFLGRCRGEAATGMK